MAKFYGKDISTGNTVRVFPEITISFEISFSQKQEEKVEKSLKPIRDLLVSLCPELKDCLWRSYDTGTQVLNVRRYVFYSKT